LLGQGTDAGNQRDPQQGFEIVAHDAVGISGIGRMPHKRREVTRR